MGAGFLLTRAISLAAAALAAVAMLAAPARADEASVLYDPATVAVVDLTLSAAAKGQLESAPETYVAGTFSFATSDGTPGGIGAFTTPRNVEVRLKGHGSFRPLSGKAAFKLKFKKADALLGLRKLTFNNMVEDPSMVHERLAYPAFRAAGVPAPRSGYVYLRVNGDDYGLYANVETVDDIALAKLFGSFDAATQHLYEGEDGTDVLPGDAADFELQEGDDGNRADLEALIAAANSAPASGWAARVGAHIDLAEMTRMWAVEKYLGQWDGYAGQTSQFQPNNYFLLSDPQGRFQMLPWGTDSTWGEGKGHLDFSGRAGLLFNRCLEDGECAATYWSALGAARGAIAGLGLDGLAASTASLLKPWQQLEIAESSREEHSLAGIAAGVEETRSFIASRPAEADRWLTAHTPPAPPPSPPATSPPTVEPPSSPSMRVGLSTVRSAVLRTRLDLAVPGTLTQSARIVVDGELRGVCRRQIEIGQPRSFTLRCGLSPLAREHLRGRWLKIVVVTSFRSAGGQVETQRRTLDAPPLPTARRD